MTKVLKVNPINPEMESIEEAAASIRNGKIVAFPTETVYGLGADAFNGNACKEIFKVKNRPMDNPLIVHISKMSQLYDVAMDIPEEIENAVKVLWPGPVTFRFKRNPKLPLETTAMLDTISVRMPAHPVALRLIDESNTPIAAPSANMATRPSGTRVEHVINDFDGKIEMILDGGPAPFGLESTIIDATVKPYLLLRPGAFTLEELGNYLDIRMPDPSSLKRLSKRPVAPGMKYRHYAPNTKLLVIDSSFLIDSVEHMPKNIRYAILCSNEMGENFSNAKLIKLGKEGNLYEIASNIFDAFRRLDRMNVELALVQAFPENGIGLALMNRMAKASGSASKPIKTTEELNRRL